MTFSDIRSRVFASLKDESGAVTVDWVVLTAAVVILSIGAISALDSGIAGLTTDINTALETADPTISLPATGGGGGGTTTPE